MGGGEVSIHTGKVTTGAFISARWAGGGLNSVCLLATEGQSGGICSSLPAAPFGLSTFCDFLWK